MSTQPSTTMSGRVATFDEPVGLGTLLADDGTEVPFHCTAIADGSRDIAVGTEVTFRLTRGRAGRREATDVRSS